MLGRPTPIVVRICSRCVFSTSAAHAQPGFLDLGARAISRENIHFSRQSGATGDNYVNHSPALELLRSERDLAEGRKSNLDADVRHKTGEKSLATGYELFNHQELQRQGWTFPEEVSPISSTMADTSPPNISAGLNVDALDFRILRAQITKLEHRVQSLSHQNKKYRSERNGYRTRRIFSSALIYFCTGVLISCFFVLDQKNPLSLSWLRADINSASKDRKRNMQDSVYSQTETDPANNGAVDVASRIPQDSKRSEQALQLETKVKRLVSETSDVVSTSSSRLRRLFWKE